MQLLISVLIGKLFALIVGIYYFRYLPRPYRLALFTIAFAAFAESYGRYIAVHMHQHNSWMFHKHTELFQKGQNIFGKA